MGHKNGLSGPPKRNNLVTSSFLLVVVRPGATGIKKLRSMDLALSMIGSERLDSLYITIFCIPFFAQLPDMARFDHDHHDHAGCGRCCGGLGHQTTSKPGDLWRLLEWSRAWLIIKNTSQRIPSYTEVPYGSVEIAEWPTSVQN